MLEDDNLNIAVCIKQVLDTQAELTLINEKEVLLSNIPLVINPYDEYAIEAAIQAKEKLGGKVVVFSMGSDSVEEKLRMALALGADEAVRIDPPAGASNPLNTAKILAKALSTHSFDIILFGKTSVDENNSVIPSAVAELLKYPEICEIIECSFNQDSLEARRKSASITEVIKVNYPVVLSVEKDLNEPRYPSLIMIRRAKTKPLQIVTVEDLGITPDELSSIEKKNTFLKFVTPPDRKSGIVFSEGSASELVNQLVSRLKEDKVI
ncbi:MAG: electron transfer flavoprotein subunit beta/FixA family protein [Candidatus Kariarchaeaceae archaeon]